MAKLVLVVNRNGNGIIIIVAIFMVHEVDGKNSYLNGDYNNDNNNGTRIDSSTRGAPELIL